MRPGGQSATQHRPTLAVPTWALSRAECGRQAHTPAPEASKLPNPVPTALFLCSPSTHPSEMPGYCGACLGDALYCNCLVRPPVPFVITSRAGGSLVHTLLFGSPGSLVTVTSLLGISSGAAMRLSFCMWNMDSQLYPGSTLMAQIPQQKGGPSGRRAGLAGTSPSNVCTYLTERQEKTRLRETSDKVSGVPSPWRM